MRVDDERKAELASGRTETAISRTTTEGRMGIEEERT